MLCCVSKTAALRILLKGVRCGEYPGSSSGHFSQSKKLNLRFSFHQSVSIYTEVMENAFKISNPKSLKKKPTHAVTLDTSVAHSRKIEDADLRPVAHLLAHYLQ